VGDGQDLIFILLVANKDVFLLVQELALPIIENEIFGEVAEAKEHAQFAMNYKEAKKVRTWDLL
jgi:hypothetical protein